MCTRAKAGQDTALNISADIAEIKIMINNLNNKMSKIESIENEFKSLKKSVEMMSEQYDDIMSKLKEEKDEKLELKKKIIVLENSISEKNRLIENTASRITTLDQYIRNKNIEIHGYPLKSGENCSDIIVNVAKEMGIDITASDVDLAHRLHAPVGKNSPPAIIATFVARKKRDLFLKQKRLVITNNNVKDLKIGHVLYINENLNAETKRLFWLAKVRARANEVKFVWFKNSKILARKTDSSPVFMIKTEDDLNKIGVNVQTGSNI